MWIFAGGMQRSASTVQFQIAAHLLEERGLGQRMPWCDPRDHGRFFAAHGKERGYRVFKTHDPTPAVRELAARGDGVCLYIHRDIPDVISSLKQKTRLNFFPKALERWTRKLLAQHESWLSMPVVHVETYENMVLDMAGSIRSLARFLGLTLSPGESAAMAAEYSPERQRERVRSLAEHPESGSVSGRFTFDAHSLLHQNHIADGSIGRHKQNLSNRDLDIIAKTIRMVELERRCDRAAERNRELAARIEELARTVARKDRLLDDLHLDAAAALQGTGEDGAADDPERAVLAAINRNLRARLDETLSRLDDMQENACAGKGRDRHPDPAEDAFSVRIKQLLIENRKLMERLDMEQRDNYMLRVLLKELTGEASP